MDSESVSLKGRKGFESAERGWINWLLLQEALTQDFRIPGSEAIESPFDRSGSMFGIRSGI